MTFSETVFKPKLLTKISYITTVSHFALVNGGVMRDASIRRDALQVFEELYRLLSLVHFAINISNFYSMAVSIG